MNSGFKALFVYEITLLWLFLTIKTGWYSTFIFSIWLLFIKQTILVEKETFRGQQLQNGQLHLVE